MNAEKKQEKDSQKRGKMKIKIENVGSGTSKIVMELTKTQLIFLRKVSLKLNTNRKREDYSPILFIEKLKDAKRSKNE